MPAHFIETPESNRQIALQIAEDLGFTPELIRIGTAGNDTLHGSVPSMSFMRLGKDLIYGGSGHDMIAGFHGDDLILGGPGNDRMAGGAGKDRLEGGTGHDVLDGGLDDDKLIGGPGHDLFVWFAKELGGTDQVLDFQLGEDKIVFAGIKANDLALFFDGQHTQLLVSSQNHEVQQTIQIDHVDLLGGESSTDALNRLIHQGTIQII